MRILVQVGSNVDVVRRLIRGHIDCQLAERYAVQLLNRGAGVGEVNQGIMSANLVQIAQAQKARVRQVYLVGFPGPTLGKHLARATLFTLKQAVLSLLLVTGWPATSRIRAGRELCCSA